MLAVACLANNIRRTFLVFWWTPADLSRRRDVNVEESGLKNQSAWKEIENRREAVVVSEEDIVAPRWLEFDMEDKTLLERLRDGLE